MTQKETITGRQAILIIAVFTFGSSAILGGSAGAGNDSWLSILLAIACALPVVCVYARIMRLYPGADIFDIALNIFGKIGGRILIVLFVLYATNLGSLVMRNYSEFVQITAKPETPQLPILILEAAIVAFLVFKGIQVLGKWAVIIGPIIIIVIVISVLLSIKHINTTNIYPILNHKFSTIANATFSLFTFPFVEPVLFLTLTSAVRKSENPYKIYIIGILIGGVTLLTAFFRNLFVLGCPLMEEEIFPSYTTLRIVNIGNFLTRVESTIGGNFYLGGITKVAVCVFGASIGAAKLFGIKNYRVAIIPVSLITLADSYFMFQNVIQMLNFAQQIYRLYAPFFQILLPVIIWIGAEIKVKKTKAAMSGGSGNKGDGGGGQTQESEA